MPGKQRTPQRPPRFFQPQRTQRAQKSGKNFLRWALLTFFAVNLSGFAADPPKFLGAQSCSSSSCHGGAGETSNQYTVWSTRDFHHERPYATLTTARSERLAEVLKLGNPTQSPRCTVCHAPLATVPAERLGSDAKITEGISCESCHGAAENWIRSHTRSDYTHADRVAAGMRDLKDLYVRANTCVACHQNLDPDIRAAGHPELIFEMDGQCATMPRHWPKAGDKPGAQIWLVGQAVALREINWQLRQTDLSKSASPEEALTVREHALFWLVQKASANNRSLPTPTFLNTKYNSRTVQEWADELARAASAAVWTDEQSKQCFTLLAGRAEDFGGGPQTQEAREAERLVLALDRLTLNLPNAPTNTTVNQSLNKLFSDAQSLPDFDPNQFAKDLNAFQASVSALESK